MKSPSKSGRKKYFFYPLTLIILSFLLLKCTSPQDKAEGIDLEQGFLNPPHSAKPRVWWHWMNGNITWEGAKADMDWMKRVGIAGLQSFDAGMATGQVVDVRLPYMTDGWKDVFAKTAAYADSLGLELGIAASPGWSETGGPWVTPVDGMKKMAYAVTYVEGGKPYTGTLNHPPTTTGVYQSSATGGGHQRRERAAHPDLAELYKDQKVLAFKVSADAILPTPVITSSGGRIDTRVLSDGQYDQPAITLPAAKQEGGISWVMFDYGQPVTVRGMEISSSAGSGPHVLFKFESSNDGQIWQDTGASIDAGGLVNTNAIDAPAARYFRLVSVKQPPVPPGPWHRWRRGTAQPPESIAISELNLKGTATVHSFESKAAFFTEHGYFEMPSGSGGTEASIKTDELLDLTDKLNEDGTLDWTPEEGQWIVLRIGYSLTGALNRPASPEATGLEVDKLDKDAVKRYMDTYLSMYSDAADGLIGNKGLKAMMFDSWEAAYTNWTPKIIQEFKRIRGYDPVPWLPALAGFVVESPEESDKFLWDWRRTIQILLKENHYDFLSEMLGDIGMIRYGEAHEAGFSTTGDGMEMKQSSDIPMGAMWMHNTPGQMEGQYFNDNQESASVAHIYGQNVASTEAFTGGPRYGTAPWDLKSTADAILLSGSNRFIIHTSAHQPISRGPGMTLGVGQMFSRNETWAEQSKVWLDYLSRSSFMLQVGNAANDIAVFYGEESTMIDIYGQDFPNIPEGYRYDYINSDVILNMLSVENSSFTTETGMNYKAIFFGEGTEKVTLPVLKKTLEFVEQGGIIIGTKPEGSPSLSDDAAEVAKLINTLWPGDGVANIGKGKVFNTKEPATVFNEISLEKDFSYNTSSSDSKVMFLHRKLNNGGIYFVANQKDHEETIEASFRISGYKAELWDAATGEISPASYEFDGTRTKVTLALGRFGSIFVVFREQTNERKVSLPESTEQVLQTLEGPWQVAFEEKRGAPATATFDKLMDFRESTDDGIRYFSGIATYTKQVEVSQANIDKGDVLIDLGEVYNIAEVWVNGKLAGTAWKPPFRVNISKYVTPGSNKIEIKTVNTWVNRLIGDAQPGIRDDEKITLTTRPVYGPNDELKASGLLGPVKVIIKD